MKRYRLAILAVAACLMASPIAVADDWPQWGGRNRNFMTDSTGLAKVWPAGGPRQLWSRALGEGYSSIAVEAGRLYTMYRGQGEHVGQDVVIAIDAATGETIWQYRYEASAPRRMNLEYGPGPHATPLVVGDRVFAVGATGKFHALDKKTGELLWAHDFYEEYGTLWRRGYSCSPLAYGDTVIVTVGGRESGVIALNQADGTIAWKKQDFNFAPASPILINLDGQEQLVVFMAKEAAGLDPASGELLWSHPHPTSYGLNISTPVWGEGNLLFLSSAYSGGSRLLQLSRAGGKTTVKELWFNNRMRIHFGNAIRIGDTVYGSSGDFGPTFFTAIDIKTGKVLWRDRSFPRFSSVYAEGRLVVLDEDGNLALVTASPEGLEVHSRVELLSNNAWTPPTLVGTTIYVRDRKTLRALELD